MVGPEHHRCVFAFRCIVWFLGLVTFQVHFGLFFQVGVVERPSSEQCNQDDDRDWNAEEKQ